MVFNPIHPYDSGTKRFWFDDERHEERKLSGQLSLEVIPVKLRPSMASIAGKKGLKGVEIGVGQLQNSINILNNMDIAQLILVDLNYPKTPTAQNSIQDHRVTFVQGNSLQALEMLPNDLDFIYLDGHHEYNFVIHEITKALKKIKAGGIIAGHDYDQSGVNLAVQTLFMNTWMFTKRKPTLYVESCLDEHNQYPLEYLEAGFPIDWWMTVEQEMKDPQFRINHLRNG